MLKRILVVALLAVPGAVAAQTRPDPRTDARIHVGPFYMTPSAQLRHFGVDTNVFNEFDNPKSDFTFTLAPRLSLWMPVTRRFLLTTRTEAGLVYFQKYTDQRSIDPAVFVRGDILLRRLSFFAEDDFKWSKERANLEIDDRVRQKVNAARAGIVFDVTPKFSTEVSLYQRTYDFDDSLTTLRAINYRAGLKRNERGLRIGLSHRLTSKTTLLLDGETQRIRFDFAGVKNADGFRISPGVEFAPRALIGGTAKVGFRRFTALNENLPDFQGLVASLNLGYTVLGATRLSFETSRDLAYSYEVSQPYYVTTGVGASIRRQIRGDIDAVLGARRTRNNYRALAEVTAPPRRDIILNYTADIGYRLTRDTRAGFVVGWQRRESTAGFTREYRGFTAGLSLTYGG
jgi:hypothetical protein